MINLKIEQKGGTIEAVMVELGRVLDLKTTLKTVGELVVEGIHENVDEQKQADGGQLKQNRPGWRKHKQARAGSRGGGNKALIYKIGRFISRQYWSVRSTREGVTIKPSTRGDAARIAEEVQRRGYVGWFGISKKTNTVISKLITKRIQQAIRRAALKARLG